MFDLGLWIFKNRVLGAEVGFFNGIFGRCCQRVRAPRQTSIYSFERARCALSNEPIINSLGVIEEPLWCHSWRLFLSDFAGKFAILSLIFRQWSVVERRLIAHLKELIKVHIISRNQNANPFQWAATGRRGVKMTTAMYGENGNCTVRKALLRKSDST